MSRFRNGLTYLRLGAFTAGVLLSCSAPSANPPATNTGGSAGSAAGGASGGTGGTSPISTGGTSGGGGGSGGATVGGTSGGGNGGAGGTPAYELPEVSWPSSECTSTVSALLEQMSLQEMAAQMVLAQQPSAASVTNLDVGNLFVGGSTEPPGGTSASAWADMMDDYIAAAAISSPTIPILYGVDAVHGQNKATGSVIFPHNIGLGCTNDPALVEEVGRITALESAAMGISWTFAPVLSVSHDDRWGRVYESFSEDADVTALLGGAATVGLQGRGGLGSGTPGIVACAKHFAGDGQATAGTSSKGGIVDRGDVQIDEAAMRQWGIRPYELALKAGLGSVMVSDARWNGVNMTSHSKLINDILKGELGFQGFVVTDWQAASSAGGFVQAANAGVDMFMEPTNWAAARDTIVGGVSADRIEDAARRVLTVKCEAGLFGWQRDTSLLSKVGSSEHREVGRRAVRQSLVVLKNDGQALPLSKGGSVWVAGSGANSLTRQCGGWTVNWQGNGDATDGTTVVEAIGKVASVVSSMDQADTAIIVLSERPYAEFQGDSESIDTLPAEDFTLLANAKSAGKKVIAIVFSGRPVLITNALDNADAWLAAFLPGTEGDGIADVLFGDYPPTGKLSHSWPRTQDQVNLNKDDPGFTPLFAFGHGLTY